MPRATPSLVVSIAITSLETSRFSLAARLLNLENKGVFEPHKTLPVSSNNSCPRLTL